MKLRLPSLLIGVLAVLVLAYVASFRKQLRKLPRLRVGPLESQVEAKPALRLFVLGDAGSGSESQYQVAAAMEARCQKMGGADAILLLGDNAYQNGLQSLDDPQWQTKIWDPYSSDCLKTLPIYPVLGNHDYKGNPQVQIDYTLVNKRWRFPNRFYGVTFGDLLHIVAFDSEMSEFCFRPNFCTVDFMADSLAKAHTTWKFVMAHHPLESSSGYGFSHKGGLRGLLLEPYLCNRADLWLSGHVHHLEHLVPADCRLEMFISGGGGGDLYPDIETVKDSKYVQASHGFLELEVDRRLLTARFISADSNILYESTKTSAQSR